MEKPALDKLRESKPKAKRSDLPEGQRWPFRFHARATMTLDRNAHALPERDREAAGLLGATLKLD